MNKLTADTRLTAYAATNVETLSQIYKHVLA